MVAQKTPEVEKDMPEEQPTYEKDDTVCKICDIDQESHERLIKQGSHSDWKNWKTWKNGKAFSSQGKVREF